MIPAEEEIDELVEWYGRNSPVSNVLLALKARAEAAEEWNRLRAQDIMSLGALVHDENGVEWKARAEAAEKGLAELDEAHRITQQGLWQDITELRASCESLREAKDIFFHNAEAWEAHAEAAEKERDMLKAALERRGEIVFGKEGD